jgi:hypothetical protein
VAEFKPTPAGPQNIREMFHWTWKQLQRVGAGLGDEGGTQPPDPPPPPAGHQHWHENIINVTPDQHHMRLVWQGEWIQQAYVRGDMVRDGDWTMYANADTEERAAPQPTGPQERILPDMPAWVEQSFLGQVVSGQKYTFSSGGWFNEIRIWAPEVGDDIEYRLITVRDPDGIAPVDNITVLGNVNENAWSTVALGDTLVRNGDVILVLLEATNSGSDTLVTGGWSRAANSNTLTTDPGVGGWGTANNNSSLRINDTDLNTTDRSTELASAGAGTLIQIVQTNDSTKSQEWLVGGDPVDQGTHFSWDDITYQGQGPGGQPTIGETCTLNILVPVPSQTKYEELAAYWPGGDPSWAAVEGYLELDGVTVAVPTNAYGVDIAFTPGAISPDWEVVAYSGLGGGAAGGGAAAGISGISVSVSEVDTTDNTWTTIKQREVPEDKGYSGELNIDAKRTDSQDYYSTRVAVLGRNDGGTATVEYVHIYELGATMLDTRVTVVVAGPNIDIQVRGRLAQDWSWDMVETYREID